MKTFQQFNEEIEYIRSDDKVVAKLKSYDSAAYTRLAQNLEKIKEREAEVKQLKEEIAKDTKDYIASLFEAEDIIRTRIVETRQFIMTLSKDPKPTETFKYAEIVKELTTKLTPELMKALDELKEKYKSVTQKQPSLKSEKKTVEEGVSTVINFLKNLGKKFLDKVKNWGAKYDKNLNNLKRKL